MHAMAGDGTQVGVRPLVAGAPGEDRRGNRSPVTAAGWRSMVLTLAVMCCVTTATPRLGRTAAVPAGNDDLLGKAEIPAAWRTQFWASPSGRALLRLDPKQVADLVPVQSGLRFCRCPACGAEERDEPLLWSLEQPKALKCRRCGVIVPSDKYPAKANGKEVPEETVEVLPGVIHHYPYHAVEEGKARYPDERLFLQARIDYEARKYLAKAALYAAAESCASPPAGARSQAGGSGLRDRPQVRAGLPRIRHPFRPAGLSQVHSTGAATAAIPAGLSDREVGVDRQSRGADKPRDGLRLDPG